MKKLLLFIASFSASALMLNAQVTLTKTLPPIGTKYMFGQYSSASIATPTEGINQTWDYSSSTVSSMFEYEIFALTAVSQELQDSFPDAKYVEMLKIPGAPDPNLNPMEFVKDDGDLLLRLGNKGSGSGMTKKTDTLFNFNLAYQASASSLFGSVRYAGSGTVKIKGKTHDDVAMFVFTSNSGADTGYAFYKVTPHFHRLMVLSKSATDGQISLWDPIATTTGIEEIKTNNAAIYPNPANNVLNIVLKDLVNNAQLTIVDITGKSVVNTSTDLINTEINIQSLNPGLYFITVQTGNTTSTQKFVKH